MRRLTDVPSAPLPWSFNDLSMQIVDAGGNAVMDVLWVDSEDKNEEGWANGYDTIDAVNAALALRERLERLTEAARLAIDWLESDLNEGREIAGTPHGWQTAYGVATALRAALDTKGPTDG